MIVIYSATPNNKKLPPAFAAGKKPHQYLLRISAQLKANSPRFISARLPGAPYLDSEMWASFEARPRFSTPKASAGVLIQL
jgi:hypothetical protein